MCIEDVEGIVVGFQDRMKAWFRGEPSPRKRGPSPSTNPANRAATAEMGTFIDDRTGVEGFLEPATTIYPMTLLLVAGDGEYLRRPVADRAHAHKVCEDHAIPLYDAAKVGYPRRMRDYERGVRGEAVSLDELPPWPGDDEVG